MHKKNNIGDSFDKATNYCKYASVQEKSANYLIDFIFKNISSKKIKSTLEFGCGGGVLTRKLNDTLDNSTIDALDISNNMLDSAKKNTPKKTNSLNWLHENIECLDIAKNYDLITSNFCAQWLQNPKKTCNKLAEKTTSLIFSTLLDSSFNSWKNTHTIFNIKHDLVKLYTFDEWVSYLGSLNLTLTYECKVFWMRFDTPIDFARYLKKIGADSSKNKFSSSLMKIRKIKKPLVVNFDVAYFCLV
jgi:malonyl-CoA O-methyltransferase